MSNSILPSALIRADAEAVGAVVYTEETYTPKKSFEFDFSTGEFIENSVGAVLVVEDPREVLRVIVEKILHDDRYHHLIYDRSYGNEINDMLAQGYEYEVVRAELERLFYEALIYHPAIRDVTDFEVSEGPATDSVFCEFVVHGAGNVDYKVQKEVSIT